MQSGPTVAYRQRNMSPEEELAERCRHVPPPMKLPDHVRAALLQATRYETVEADGVIRFELLGRKYEYFHASSPTCQNRRGKRVLITFSYDFMEAVFVLADDRRYIETIPQKGTVAWFDGEALGREIRDQEIQIAAARRELEKTHAADIRARAETGRRNLDQIEIASRAHVVHTFPLDAPTADDRPQPERTNTFPVLQRAGPTVPFTRPPEASDDQVAERDATAAAEPVARGRDREEAPDDFATDRTQGRFAPLHPSQVSPRRGAIPDGGRGGTKFPRTETADRMAVAASAARRQVGGARQQQATAAERRRRALAALLG